MSEKKEFVSAFPLPPTAFYIDKSEEEIQTMTPPEIPEKEITNFGQRVSTSLGLPDIDQMGLSRLYDVDLGKTGVGIKQELVRLNGELKGKLRTLLESNSAEVKLTTDIVLHYQNMHHLLNMLRSHQAIASLQEALSAK